MNQSEFESIWQSWVAKGELFESRPGVFVSVGGKLNEDPESFKVLRKMLISGFIYESKPKEYRIVDPVVKGHVHHFVCECGEERE